LSYVGLVDSSRFGKLLRRDRQRQSAVDDDTQITDWTGVRDKTGTRVGYVESGKQLLKTQPHDLAVFYPR